MTRRLLGMVGPERRWIALAAAAAAVTLVAGVGLVGTSAVLVSRAAVVESTTTLALAITCVRLFAVLRATGRYVERYVGHLGTFRILTRTRTWFFRSIAPLGPARLTDERRGDLVGRVVGDVETLQDFYLRVTVPPLAAAVTALVASVAVGAFDVRLGLLLGAFLLVGGLAVPLATGRAGVAAARATAAGRARRDAEVTEALAGLDELVVLGEETRVAAVIAAAEGPVADAELHTARIRGLTATASAILAMSASVALLAAGSALVAGGGLDPIHLALMPLVALAAFEAVAPLTALPEHLHRSRVAATRLFELVDEGPEVRDPVDPAAPPAAADIVVSGLTFRYGPDTPAVLTDVDFAIPAGSRVAVVGPSGSGKSTLASLLVRFHEFHDGRITLGGTDLRDLRAADVRDAVAVVLQDDHLFDTTVRDNLLLAVPDADDDELLAALDDAGLGDVVRALPAGLSEPVGESGSRLSGGERQRLMIARALLRETPVLVLDEATAHLDPVTERAVLAAVDRRRRGRTTITIGHHAEADETVDLVVEVDRGRCRVRSPGGGQPVSASSTAEVKPGP